MDSILSFIVSIVSGIGFSFLEIFFTKWLEKHRELTVTVNQTWRADNFLTKDIIDNFREILGIQAGDYFPLDASFARFSISSTGRAAIKQEDYDKPLRFTFGENAEILKFNLIHVSTIALEPSITTNQERSQLSVAPLLLNPKDEFTVEIFGFRIDSVNPIGRFIGMSEIKPSESRRILISNIQKSRTSAIGFLKLGILFIFTLLFVAVLLLIWQGSFSIPAIPIVDQLANFICLPFLGSPPFRVGFLTAVILLLVISRIAQLVIFIRAQLLEFTIDRSLGKIYIFSDK